MENNVKLQGLESLIKDLCYKNERRNSAVIGHIFEDYVKNYLLGDKDYHRISAEDFSVYQKKGNVPHTFRAADLIITNMISKNQYGVQCKYRREPLIDLENEEEKVDYYNKKRNPPLYYTIGFGGYAYSPDAVYLISAKDLLNKGMAVAANELEEFRII